MSYIPPPPAPAPLIVAHRGASSVAPENTISAFRAAHAAHADLYELDVHLTKDGKVVVVHDSTLARTTNVEDVYPERKPWRVSDFTLSEIGRLDAGGWFAKQYTGEPVPTLRSVLDAMKDGPGLALEVKRQTESALMAKRLARLLPLAPKNTIVQSFDATFIKQLRTDTDLGVLGPTPPGGLRALAKYADYASVPRRTITAEYVRRAHRVGLKVLAYTVNKASVMNRILDAGADGMMTNRPRVIRKQVQIRQDRLSSTFLGLPFSWLKVDVMGGKLASDLYSRKIRKFFDLLDGNNDEVVSSEDFLGHLYTSADADADQRLTFGDVADAHESTMLDAPDASDQVRPIAQAILTIAGVGDGAISKSTYVSVMRDAFGLPEQEAGEAFDTLDTDARGELTQDQLLRALEGFFCTDVPDTYGNGMFGRF